VLLFEAKSLLEVDDAGGVAEVPGPGLEEARELVVVAGGLGAGVCVVVTLVVAWTFVVATGLAVVLVDVVDVFLVLFPLFPLEELLVEKGLALKFSNHHAMNSAMSEKYFVQFDKLTSFLLGTLEGRVVVRVSTDARVVEKGTYQEGSTFLKRKLQVGGYHQCPFRCRNGSISTHDTQSLIRTSSWFSLYVFMC
jgi:hypothetical protein